MSDPLIDSPKAKKAKSPTFAVDVTPSQRPASRWAVLKEKDDLGRSKALSVVDSPGGGGMAIKKAAIRLQEARKRAKTNKSGLTISLSEEPSPRLDRKAERGEALNWKQMLAEAESATETTKREQEHMAAEIYLGEAAAERACPDLSQIDAHLSFRRSGKDQDKANAVVRELLDSEDKYRTDIGRTLEFLKPLVEVFEDNAQELRTIHTFVSNLVQIEQMHTRLGNRLDALDAEGDEEDADADADAGKAGAGSSSGGGRDGGGARRSLPSLQRIASTFTAFIASTPDFDFCYACHADTYENVLDVLKSEREEDDHVQLFLQATDEALRQHGLQWGAALYRPVKRVMDYRGFFERALKYTPAVHPEHVYVREALEGIMRVAKHVNEVCACSERA